MILRRIASAVRRQDWAAVLIELGSKAKAVPGESEA